MSKVIFILILVALFGCSTNSEPTIEENTPPVLSDERPEKLKALDLYKEWVDGVQVAATLFGVDDERIVILDIWPPMDNDDVQSLQLRRWIKNKLSGHTETFDFGNVNVNIHMSVINDEMKFKVEVFQPRVYPVLDN